MTSKVRKSLKPSRSALLAELEKLPLNARIDENYVAAARNCSVATVRRDRVVGGGVPFIVEGGTVRTLENGQVRRFGSRVHYIKADLIKFLESRSRTYRSTTEADQAQAGQTA